MNVLVIDIGGTNVKLLASGQTARRKFPSGRDLTPAKLVEKVKELTSDWKYEAVTIGYPGPILCGQPMTDPANLGPGWMGYDFAAAFGLPVKVMNDAAMQALGVYEGGKMLFVGLGTGFGATVIMDGVIEPLELGRFRYKKGTLEDYVGVRGLKRLGRKKWQRHVEVAVGRLITALKPTDVVIGGGNAKKLRSLPPGTRLGGNDFAFVGGFRMWDRETGQTSTPPSSTNGTSRPKPVSRQPHR